ncbi:MAG: putative LytR family regulatory protein [Ilumatobacteraceae bacterium]|nr:putative LytR family regulatory protein [Ilumatobacteraceae bacterium]
MLSLLVALVLVGGAGALGVIASANRTIGKVSRVPEVSPALSPTRADIENFLLVGSDSRADVDPNSPDAGGIGSSSDVTGSRSDTIMVLRLDKSNNTASLLSIPRDLWIAADKSRINGTFNQGATNLVQAVTSAKELTIPIQHYVEIDFSGFKDLVDALGGVQVCFELPTRDTNTGLNITEPGCPVLSGVQALAYARSRHYEQFKDGAWHEDGSSDLGRSSRQRDFVNRALQAALDKIKVDPFASGNLVAAISKSLHVDAELDPLAAVDKLRSAVAGGIATYSLPVVGKTISGNAVLVLGDGSQAVLDYFRGVTNTPPAAT